MGLQPVLETDTVMALARGIEPSDDNDVQTCTWTKLRLVSFTSELTCILFMIYVPLSKGAFPLPSRLSGTVHIGQISAHMSANDKIGRK
jgi:hypothetical protein